MPEPFSHLFAIIKSAQVFCTHFTYAETRSNQIRPIFWIYHLNQIKYLSVLLLFYTLYLLYFFICSQSLFMLFPFTHIYNFYFAFSISFPCSLVYLSRAFYYFFPLCFSLLFLLSASPVGEFWFHRREINHVLSTYITW